MGSNPITDSDFFFVTCLQSNEYFIFHFILFIHVHVDGGKLFNLDRIIINSPPLVQGAGDAFFSKRIDQVIKSENWLKEVFIFLFCLSLLL